MGRACFIQRADRLPELLTAFCAHLGDVVVQPFQPRIGRDANLVLVRGRKTARGPFRLLPPILLHCGESHLYDAEDYTPEIRAVLRDAAPLRVG